MIDIKYYFIAIGVLYLIANIQSLYLLKSGAYAFEEHKKNGKPAWVGYNFMIFWVGSAVLSLVFPLLSDTVTGKDCVLPTMFGCMVVWLVTMVVYAIVISSALTEYIQYKRDCITSGIDIKEHVGKYLVTTRSMSYSRQYEIVLWRIFPVPTWLGEYAEYKQVVVLQDQINKAELSKELVTSLTKKYFKNRKEYRNTYLVEDAENSTLVPTEDNKTEVIYINQQGD